MNKLIYILCVLFLFNCDSENAPDCIQTAGVIIKKEYSLDAFTAIDVFDNIEVVITQLPTQKVVLETGKNLVNDITISVENGVLTLKNANHCNYARDYNVTKVYIDAPQLKTIKNCSSAPITSNGVLEYDVLHLSSENSNKIGDYRVDGTLNLEVKSKHISLVVNNLCTTTLKGSTDNLIINYANGDARFEGRYLDANTVYVYHRGSNDIIVNPKQKITGKLVSTGNLVLVNKPLITTIDALYKGKVIVE